MAFCDPKHVVAQLHLQEGMVVADFGSGAGYVGAEVAQCVGESGVVYLIDIQQELLTKATHFAKDHQQRSLVYLHADLEAEHGSTLRDETVDVVIMSNFLFQIERKGVVLKEAYRILHTGGTLLVVDWRDSYGGIGPQPEHVLSEATVHELAKEAGFSFHAEIDAGEYHYGLLFKR